MRRFLAVTASAVFGVAALPALPAGARTGPALDWVRCEADEPGQEDPPPADVQCAGLRVPVDWARGGATIELSLVRRQATGDRIGTIVYLPGGPGDSGIRQLIDRNRVTPVAEARFDVVSLDPRGTNRRSGRPSVNAGSASTAVRTARRPHSCTPRCTRTGCGRWCSTASSTTRWAHASSWPVRAGRSRTPSANS
ncbi:hypothetical protein FHS29_004762 [Saccharothrix tamanrassetensis]|uniref:Uncharacterized protein n=1 Tax=Saccharothrix tamanrassetensis TaxID=1051531 RepID=A0A841CP64_9PSEU|nr:hypothetical protein [Saccharothrix tamanrassetensis]MBB5958154.1 hypothetical protein [Saccharothrix tamanrassetensis]